MADRQFDLAEIRAHLEGPTTSPLFLLDACRWLVDEVERLNTACSIDVGVVGDLEQERPDLKRVLIELGNRLVTEYGWGVAAGTARLMTADDCALKHPDTGSFSPYETPSLLRGVTIQINSNPEMRELLNEFGFDWPINEKGVG